MTNMRGDSDGDRGEPVPPPATARDGSPSPSAVHQRIVAATLDVAATLGFPAVRTDDIVATAGVSRRTFWTYFADKSAAFAAGYAPIADALRVHTRRAHDDVSDPVERVVVGLRAIVDFLAADPVRANVLLVQGPCAGRAVVAVRVRTMGELTAMLASTVAQLDAPPTVPPERTAIVLESLAGGLHEVAYAHAVRGDVHRLAGRIPQLARFVLWPFLGPRTAAALSAPLAKLD